MKNICKRSVALLATIVLAVFCTVGVHAAEEDVLFKLDSLDKITTFDDADYQLDGTKFSIKKNEKSTEWVSTVIGSQDWTDYVIEFDAHEWVEGQICFRWNGDLETDGINCYTVGVDGLYMFTIKWKKGQATVMDQAENAVTGGAPWATPYVLTPPAHWKITVVGDVFSVYVNDMTIPKVQVTDSEFKNGSTGMITKMSLANSPSAIFENFTVYKYNENTDPSKNPASSNTASTDNESIGTDKNSSVGVNKPMDNSKDNGGNAMLISIIVSVILVVVAVVVFLIVITKKRNKKDDSDNSGGTTA